MHEMSITRSLLKVAEKAAEDNGAQSVVGIKIGIGRYSGIIPEYVVRCFDILKPGTIADKASLSFEELPTRIRCRVCGAEGEPSEETSGCRVCGATDVQMTSGFDASVISIEAT